MVRKANTKDISKLTNLALQLWPDNNYDELKREMEDILRHDGAVFFLFFDESEPVGFAQCQLRYDYVEGTESSPVGYLEGIFVSEKYGNKGVATQLIQRCEQWSKEKGCSEFASDCELSNVDSYAFHLKYGFQETNRIICFKKTI